MTTMSEFEQMSQDFKRVLSEAMSEMLDSSTQTNRKQRTQIKDLEKNGDYKIPHWQAIVTEIKHILDFYEEKEP